jgi:hypothetical protein
MQKRFRKDYLVPDAVDTAGKAAYGRSLRLHRDRKHRDRRQFRFYWLTLKRCGRAET